MNKIVGALAVATAVLVVVIAAALLPEVTVGHESVEPFQRQFGAEDKPITLPIPWLVVSALAVGIGAWRIGWFIRWLERHNTS